MTVDEVRQVQRLLGAFFPNAKQLTNSDLWVAWKIALAHYEYEDIRKRIIEYATNNKFFPGLADITQGLAEKKNFVCSRASMKKYAVGSEYQKRWAKEDETDVV